MTAYWTRGDDPPWAKIRDYAKDDVLATLLVREKCINLVLLMPRATAIVLWWE